MSLNNISFNLGQGGLGRALPGEDHISGLLFYSATLPSGFTVNNRVRQFFSLADAEAAGIVGTFADETKATATFTVTSVGANGDKLELKVNDMLGAVVSLGIYTKSAAESTTTLAAAAIAAVINAGTTVHGFTAVGAVAVVTITAKPGLGIFINSGTPLTATYSAGATLAGTLVQFTGGVASKYAVWHYHISEFFRLQPKGVLFVGIYAVPGSYTFTEITTMQNFANGKIRQIGVFKDGAAFASGDITLIHGVCAANVAAHKEIVALYAADIAAVADISTIADLATLTANYCSAIIGQDGAAKGARLYLASGKSVTVLGATLGAIAKAKVSHSIAWIAQFNISNGVECDVLAFANGVLFSNSSVTDSLLDTIDNRRYIFLRKFVGISGSYFNENSASIALSSDYAFISDNRTIQKATRGIYASVLPALNSPITLKSDGTLSDEAAAYFEGLAGTALDEMVRNGELSGYAANVNTVQNVLSTGILTINVTLVQIGTARNIVVNIGYNVTI